MLQVPLRVSLFFLAAATSLPSIPAQKGPAQRGQDAGRAAQGKANPRGALVARVGAHEIRERELIQEFNRQLPMVTFHRKVSPEKREELRKKALDKLIERSLIQQDAVERGITVSDAEIRAEFKKTLATAGKQYKNVSDAEFAKLLAQYRPRVVRRVLIDKNEARFRASLPKVEPEALEKVYKRMLEHDREPLLSPQKSHLQHIFVKVDPAAVAKQLPEKKARADAAHELLVKGKPFAEVARLYSEDKFAKKGGDLGVVGRGSIRSRNVDKAAFALAAGEVTPVLRSLYGFHIVRCVKVQPRRLSPLDEVRPRLREWLEKDHHARARKAWFAKMRESFRVEIKELPKAKAADKSGKKGTAVGTAPGKHG